MTKIEYMDRFTPSELAAIYSAAKVSIQVEVWLEKFKVAEDVDITDPRTIDGLRALEAAGLIAPGRADEILGTVAEPEVVIRPSVGVYLLANQITVVTEGEDPPDDYLRYWPLTPSAAELIDSGGTQLRVVGDNIEIVSSLT